MRILMVELSPSGGLFHFTFQLGSHLAARGHSVALLTGPDPELTSQEPRFRVSPTLPTWHAGREASVPAPVHKVRRVFRALLHVRALGSIVGTLVRERPDAMFWHPPRFPVDSLTILLARALAPRTTMAIVLHEPRPLTEQAGREDIYRTNPLVIKPLGAAIRSFDAIFVLGERTKQYTCEIWNPRAEVRIVPHGDEGVFRGDQEVPPVADTRPVVLCFGTLTRYKGIDVLLDAFELVRKEVADAQLTFAGSVSGDFDESTLRERAEAIGGIELDLGYVDMKDVPALFGSARVVAAPYIRASQSGVVHLAQTFARPVVASDVGDIPAAVPDGVAGFVVPPGDPSALAEALVRLLEEPTTADRMGRAGQARLEAEGSWDDVAAVVEADLQQPGGRRS